MGSKKGGKRARWGSPAGWVLKDIVHIYYKDGHRENTIGECLRRHVPREVYVPIIGQDVTDNAIAQRGHKGILPKNAFEHPDKHPMGIKMMPLAKEIVSNKLKLTLEELNRRVDDVLSSDTTDTVTIEMVTVDDKALVSGIFYVIESDSPEHSCFGITTKDNARKRMAAFAKGDIEDRMKNPWQMWMQNPRPVETAIKKKFKEEHIGNERYNVPASTIRHFAVKYANELRVAHYLIVEDLKEAAE